VLIFQGANTIFNVGSLSESVISFFEEQNIHFDIALTTEQGLKLYRKELYDLIITDMGRGDESNAGITLIKELNFLHCQVPVIVYCSMAAIRRYSDEAIRLGAYRVVNGTANITSLITDICGLSN
ncbi:response regulator, partial [Thomasclavelia cocleata]|uniref:response regulator n=1 Tax=Thomasclavelia cocleata TaxID=69824 RepID=UPI00256EEADF